MVLLVHWKYFLMMHLKTSNIPSLLLLDLLACHVNWSRTLGNKMLTESIIQVFLFAHLCMFSRIISKVDMPQFHQKDFIHSLYAKANIPTVIPVNTALNPNKATS